MTAYTYPEETAVKGHPMDQSADRKMLQQILFDLLDAHGLMGSGLHDIEETYQVSEGQARFIRSCAKNHDIVIPEVPEKPNV